MFYRVTYRVTYLPTARQPTEVVEAERVEVDGQGIWLVFRHIVFVMNNPRDVVAAGSRRGTSRRGGVVCFPAGTGRRRTKDRWRLGDAEIS